MNDNEIKEAIQKIESNNFGVVKLSEIADLDIRTRVFYKLIEEEILEPVLASVYRLKDGMAPIYQDVLAIQKAYPMATMCLISALSLHELTLENSSKMWFAFPRGSRLPTFDYPPTQFVQMNLAHYELGTEIIVKDGIQIRVTDPEKTVVDCFKYRSKVTEEVAVEAIKEWGKSRRGKGKILMEYAEVCRVRNIIEPYFKSIFYENE